MYPQIEPFEDLNGNQLFWVILDEQDEGDAYDEVTLKILLEMIK